MWSDILSALEARIKSVSYVGQVHDYIRWSEGNLGDDDFESKFISTTNGTKVVKFWMATFSGFDDVSSAEENATARQYKILVEGFWSHNDKDASEKKFKQLVLDVANALTRQDSTFGGFVNALGNIHVETPRNGAAFNGISCHYAKMTFMIEETYPACSP